MKLIIKIFCILVVFTFSLVTKANTVTSNKIIANIDDQIISSFELKNRVKTILFLGRQELNQSNVNKTKNEAMRYLINSKLKKKEINNFKIEIEETQRVRDYLLRLSSQFNTNIPGLKKEFNNSGIDFELFLENTKIDFAWQKLIYKIYNNKLIANIDEGEIEKELNLTIKKQKNITEYKLAEIEILIEKNKDVNELVNEIKNQINVIGFENTAIKFSSSSSALEGGSLGWISEKSLSNKMRVIIKPLKIESISEAIIQPNSILFLKLLNKRKMNIENINLEEIRQKIVADRQNELLNLFASSHLSKIKNKALIQIK